MHIYQYKIFRTKSGAEDLFFALALARQAPRVKGDERINWSEIVHEASSELSSSKTANVDI